MMGTFRGVLAGMAGLIALAPLPALAQALSCTAPGTLPAPHAENPSSGEPRRNLPIGSYTLALIWSPQHCHDHGREADARLQCRSETTRFGFTLHGLWPDGLGKTWPQYCRPARILPKTVLRQHFCATPSVQLLQHEWAKHGTCMTTDPSLYFHRSNALYGRIRYPDMAALSRREGLTAGALAQAIANANRGMRADMMRITANRNGWLEEVWFCLDKAFRYKSCPAHQGGLKPDAPIRIWRGRA